MVPRRTKAQRPKDRLARRRECRSGQRAADLRALRNQASFRIVDGATPAEKRGHYT